MKESNNSTYSNTVFNFWVEVNYDLISQTLSENNALNEDALHDAFIDTYIAIQNDSNISLEAISEVFNKCYKKTSRRSIAISFKYIPFEDNILEFIVNQNYSVDESFKRINCNNIIALTRNVLTHEEYRLLSLYVWVEGMSFEKLSIYTGIPKSTLYEKVTAIKEKAAQNITI